MNMAEEPKAPALFFYVKDYSSDIDVRNFSAEQRGWYTQLLWDAWDNNPQGFLYNDDAKLQSSAKAKIPQCPTPLLSVTCASELFAQALVESGKYEDLPSALGSTEVQRGFNAYFKEMEKRREEAQLVLDAQFNKEWKEVKAKFKKHGDFIYHKRLLEEKVKQIDNRAKKQKAAMEGVNAKRAKRGLPPLEVEPGLDVGVTEVERMLAGVPTEVVAEGNQRLTLSIPIAISEENTKEKYKRKVEHEGKRLADAGFILSKELMDYALEKISRPVWFDDPQKTHADLITDFVLPDFITYWNEDKTNKAWKKDWPAAWRTWCRKAKVFGSYERNRWNGAPTTVAITPSEDAAEDIAFTESILASHEANSRYACLDVRDVYATMKRWCVEKGKDDTPELLVEWLEHNLSEQPTPLFDNTLPKSYDDDLQDFKNGELYRGD